MTNRRKHECEERRVLAWADDELRVRRRSGAQHNTAFPRAAKALSVFSGGLYQRAGC